MIRSHRRLPALMIAGLWLASPHGAAAQSLNDLANQFLRPQQGPDRDAAARDAYERGRADAYRDQRNRDDLRGQDDRSYRDDDRRRAEEDRRRRFDEEQRRRADFDRAQADQDRANGDRARQQGYGR